MKKLFIVFALYVLSPIIANAQENNKLKLGLGGGFVWPAFNDVERGAGWLITIEPAILVSDKLSFGLRIEGASTVSDVIGSITGNSQLYLSDDKNRFFVGLGLGWYGLTDFDYGESAFGFYPRAGFDLGHLTLALDFNIFPETYGYPLNNYFGLRFGGFFGGGKKTPALPED